MRSEQSLASTNILRDKRAIVENRGCLAKSDLKGPKECKDRL